MVERRWYEQWKEFVENEDQNSSSFPGQINNTGLFDGQQTPCLLFLLFLFLFILLLVISSLHLCHGSKRSVF